MIALALAGCDDFERRDLEPYPSSFGEGDPGWAEQPRRENPLEVAVSQDGRTAWISLQGSPDAPGRSVVPVDLATGEAGERLGVGSGPTGLALHPAGRLLVVLNRFSNYASVIDTERGRVTNSIPLDFYAIEAAFTPDGAWLFVTNRAADAVQVLEVGADGGELRVLRRHPDIPVGTNPRDLAMSADGRTLAVAALTGTTLSLIDVVARTERARIEVGAPIADVVIAGDVVIAATLSASTHHPPFAGPDGDGDGVPGDGTPNINFQDLQNELATFDLQTGEPGPRYTSEGICCRDYRDVDPRDVGRFGDLLPPPERRIVAGALPEQMALDGDALWVTYSGSNELQRFDVGAGGALTPGPVFTAGGHNPHGIAVAGDRLVVAHRLGETAGIRSASDGSLQATVVGGDGAGGACPATDAEIGELFNFVTAPFTVDGGQTCQHCHREGGNIDKAFSMPLLRHLGLGLRQTMDYRGAADTRPWFFEAAMNQANFVPVMNEFARIENFCCSDYTLWPGGPPDGCAQSPPPECETAPNPYSPDGSRATRATDAEFASPRPTPDATRDAFYRRRMQEMIGRTESFADGLYWEDPVTETRNPVELDFDGITRALGLFLMQDTHLLPNPHDPERAAVRRGRALFESLETGCSVCHPSPTFSTSTGDELVGVRMGPVVSPVRGEDDTNLDLLSGGFLDLFPRAEMDRCADVCGAETCDEDPFVCDDLLDVKFGVTSLRGIWDRADGMLHHGLARGLREVLCTPGHPALKEGEIGFNERDGIPDTHGGTSHLSEAEIRDLIDFLRTL